ncbi:MAG: MBL fold metallo-hydrolase [Methanocellales archaeon]|nr:MBL fold metallo-hydrolase [Methanocellales archaeon]
MATYVETSDLSILIDPGVSLAPIRYGLPPHPLELGREAELWRDIEEHAMKADVLVVTHYHYDHHDPSQPEIYEGKMVYIKHPSEKINRSQYARANYFLEKLAARSIKIADGNEYKHGKTLIRFSPPVYHGTNPRLGYVVQTSISCGREKLVYTSDVEGPSVEAQMRFVLDEKPNILILDGPMTYMLGYRYSKKSLELSVENMVRMVRETPVETLILEHHFMRDLRYKERIMPVYEAAEDKVKVITAAEYVGRSIEMLEARRKELYERASPPHNCHLHML